MTDDPKGTGKPVRTVVAGRRGAAGAMVKAPEKSTGLWLKKDTSSGRFMKIKSSGGTFKGVKRER
jgi:hypothetical protein